ncbi:MAG TPA: hypothetical protein IAA48_03135 [Candidatus Eubacterium faecipullorum]|uniref:Uncharacterized protein n=1 Tax=Candidatus Eubacterium faecipullorum TaxID=2838571 RepID=A0A9D1UF32_9FIRM|nr:hypothetical protein [Candidatus Eubacterium faecipullorum]
MPDIFNLTDEMSAYFNSLPKSVQSALVYSGAKANSLADLKQLVEGFSGNGSAQKNKAVSSPHRSYRKKYRLNPHITNRYCANMSNPTVQPDERTEMGIPIPSVENVEYSKEYQEENKL